MVNNENMYGDSFGNMSDLLCRANHRRNTIMATLSQDLHTTANALSSCLKDFDLKQTSMQTQPRFEWAHVLYLAEIGLFSLARQLKESKSILDDAGIPADGKPGWEGTGI